MSLITEHIIFSVPDFEWPYIFNYLGYLHLGVQWLCHVVVQCLIFDELLDGFPMWVHHFTFSSVWMFWFLYVIEIPFSFWFLLFWCVQNGISLQFWFAFVWWSMMLSLFNVLISHLYVFGEYLLNFKGSLLIWENFFVFWI